MEAEEKATRVLLRQIFVEARNRLGLTQADVAKECGITQGAVSQFESGLSGLNSGTLEKLRVYILRVADEKAAAATPPPAPLMSPADTPFASYAALSALLHPKPNNFLVDVEQDLQKRLNLERELSESEQRLQDIEKKMSEYVLGLETKAADLAVENAALKSQLAKLTGKKPRREKSRKIKSRG